MAGDRYLDGRPTSRAHAGEPHPYLPNPFLTGKCHRDGPNGRCRLPYDAPIHVVDDPEAPEATDG